ncbi:hypothetical protein HU200_005279 [Digitaria exilis]|uniref:Uncharacterized protein n=1 Tax=Digitaria exilis TaxID=1010633 RepID=A0A835FR94_9POAL|nr:hypothetical protein HU200_005279 [Digitaria exilis]
MEELFGESPRATGSLAVDQGNLDAEDDRSESGSDDSFTAEDAVGCSPGMKRKNKKSPMKKHRKEKAKRAKALENDKIAKSIVMLADSIASSVPAPTDPYANLWKRIEDIPFPPWDKVDIASFLSKPEQVHLRNYLNDASDQSFGTWVTDYLGAKYGCSGGYTDQ